MSLKESYRKHLETLDRQLGAAVETAGRNGVAASGVLFHSGRVRTYHADDEAIVFRPAAHFRRWVPPLDGPEHAVLARPGKKPKVVRVRPRDFWHDSTPPPASYWEDAVELDEVASFDEIPALLGDLDGVAFVGESAEAAATLGIGEALVNPGALLAPLDWHRAYKTELEVALIRAAAEMAAAGHLRALAAFEDGASEREIHWAYLAGSGQLEREIPYETIIALDEKGAFLHYQNKRGDESAPGRTLLIDAGSAYEGYAADVTRTWARPGVAGEFTALLRGVDAFQRDLVAQVTAGRPYLDVHLETHRRTAELLAEVGVVRGSAEEALERGITRAFLPHGVGHHLGLQVHDVGGHQAGPEGGKVPPPEEHALLRNTRLLEPGQVVTIEPGVYFIPMLLDPLREGEDAGLVDWPLVDRLAPLGGIRIEDDVLCTEGEPRDLTRDLIAGPPAAG